MSDATLTRGPAVGANFTEGSVHLHILRLSGFMFVGMAASIVASLFETVYIGVIGTAELAAVSFTFPVVMLVTGLAMGLGTGASSIIARTMGAGDRDKVRSLASHCLILVISVILTMAIVCRSYSEPIFKLLGAQPHILPLIVEYMDVWFLGLTLYVTSIVGTFLIRATGSVMMPGLIPAIGATLQVIIAPFLIFGIGPAPELGLVGAAWAFVIARTISFSVTFFVITVREKLITMNLNGLIASWRQILHVGLPATATSLIVPVSMGIITRMLASHGPEVVAGFGVGSRVDALVTMIVMAVSMTTGPFIGQNWGARKFDRVNQALSLTYRFSILWGVFAFLFMLLAGEYLVTLINDDPKVVETAANFLIIIPLSIGFMGITAIASTCFNALGKPLPPLILSINRMFLVYIPLALLGDYLWGYIGIFIATSATTILMGIVAWYWNKLIIRREILRMQAAH
jgi:putative MATE family efflux protein|tara:strand:+ start:2732 stop:4108 length:1377 start_codon:yes stop_codon:yes gene_type:complete